MFLRTDQPDKLNLKRTLNQLFSGGRSCYMDCRPTTSCLEAIPYGQPIILFMEECLLQCAVSHQQFYLCSSTNHSIPHRNSHVLPIISFSKKLYFRMNTLQCFECTLEERMVSLFLGFPKNWHTSKNAYWMGTKSFQFCLDKTKFFPSWLQYIWKHNGLDYVACPDQPW